MFSGFRMPIRGKSGHPQTRASQSSETLCQNRDRRLTIAGISQVMACKRSLIAFRDPPGDPMRAARASSMPLARCARFHAAVRKACETVAACRKFARHDLAVGSVSGISAPRRRGRVAEGGSLLNRVFSTHRTVPDRSPVVFCPSLQP
jgi:hypothetical protein